MTDANEIETVVSSASAYGKASTDTEAFQKWAAHAGIDPNDTQVAELFRVRGFDRIDATGLRCDEVVSEETFRVSGEDTNRLLELMGDLELLTEDIMAASEVEDDV